MAQRLNINIENIVLDISIVIKVGGMPARDAELLASIINDWTGVLSAKLVRGSTKAFKHYIIVSVWTDQLFDVAAKLNEDLPQRVASWIRVTKT